MNGTAFNALIEIPGSPCAARLPVVRMAIPGRFDALMRTGDDEPPLCEHSTVAEYCRPDSIAKAGRFSVSLPEIRLPPESGKQCCPTLALYKVRRIELAASCTAPSAVVERPASDV